MADLPLFSFLMICYNQENTIAEALNSALSQDYPGLEIIVSDDHSSDGTFERAQEIASSYHGPHSIILNRNPQNLGIGPNFHKACSLSHGEWLFMAAGDDVSLPNRCALMATCLKDLPDDIRAVCTPREIIDGEGHFHGYDIWRKAAYGASTAWHRSLFDDFPPIPMGIMYEDAFLTFRLFMAGYRLLHTNLSAVKYRIDGVSVTSSGQNGALQTQKKVSVIVKRLLTLLDAVEADMGSIPQIYPSETAWKDHFQKLRRILTERDQTARLAVAIMEKPWYQNLPYLFSQNGLAGHLRFSDRAKWLLHSKSWLYSIKQRFFPSERKIYSPFIHELPHDLKPVIQTAEQFLNGDFLKVF